MKRSWSQPDSRRSEQSIFANRGRSRASGIRPRCDSSLHSSFADHRAGARAENSLLQVCRPASPISTNHRRISSGDLVIIAARPSVGKTALVLNIAQHVGTKTGRTVGIFSLEMSKEQLFLRMLTSEARIDSHRLRTGFLVESDWGRLSHALGTLSEAKIFIDDTPGIGVLEMRAKARRLMAEHGLDVLVVDYIQLMQGRGRFENRTLELAAISRSLKVLAKELNVPVIILSQLSRAPEARSDHRPMLSDLRESGALEQDAEESCGCYARSVPDVKPEERTSPRINVGSSETERRSNPYGRMKSNAFRKSRTSPVSNPLTFANSTSRALQSNFRDIRNFYPPFGSPKGEHYGPQNSAVDVVPPSIATPSRLVGVVKAKPMAWSTPLHALQMLAHDSRVRRHQEAVALRKAGVAPSSIFSRELATRRSV